MKIQIDLEKLKQGLRREGFAPLISGPGDLKTVLETKFTDDGFISGNVKVTIVQFEQNTAVVSLHSADTDRLNERILCAARHVDRLVGGGG
jgi:hypothetical protein